MALIPKELETRLGEYLRRYGAILDKELGYGWDGFVFSTTGLSAIKCLRFPQ